jgi:hypothetical protein
MNRSDRLFFHDRQMPGIDFNRPRFPEKFSKHDSGHFQETLTFFRHREASTQ